MNAMHWKVELRDFGDNCYIMYPDSPLPSLNLKDMSYITGRNCYLRNGNAVVHICVQSSIPRNTTLQEMDRLIAEMDARTAFFRE
jgi:hypothetical protein